MIQLVILLIVCLCCCSCVGGALNAIEDSLEKKKAENAAKKNKDTFNNLDGQVNRNDNIKWYN